MKLSDSEAVKCRYGDCIAKKWLDSEVLFDLSENSYQGTVLVALVIPDDPVHVRVIEYSYGSCSGCDDWESRDLSDAQIAKEIARCTSKMTKALLAKRLDKYIPWDCTKEQLEAAREALK